MRLGWENDKKIYFKERQWERMDWINWAEDSDNWQAVVNTVMNMLVV